jgi:hypothetical protein
MTTWMMRELHPTMDRMIFAGEGGMATTFLAV